MKDISKDLIYATYKNQCDPLLALLCLVKEENSDEYNTDDKEED